MRSRQQRRVVLFAALASVATVLLVSCTPAEPTAVRLNEDGSIDFVSCRAVDDVATATATTTFRVNGDGIVDQSTATEVDLDPPIDQLVAGKSIEFVGLPNDWDRLDITVESSGTGNSAYAYAERDKLSIGEWRWMDEGAILPTGSRCDIDNQ